MVLSDKEVEEIKQYASEGYKNNPITLFEEAHLENFYNLKKLKATLEFFIGRENINSGLTDILNQFKEKVKPEDVLINNKEKIPEAVLKREYRKKIYVQQIKQSEISEIVDNKKPVIQFFVANYIQNVKSLYDRQPFFFDNTGQFWIWDETKFKYTEIDDIDLMNCLDDAYDSAGQTIDGSTKSKYMESFKKIGRKNKPKELSKEWIQFKGKIFNILTKEIKEATPKNFLTNPLPWDIGESDDTTTIDKLFNDWVGEKYVKTLYEIIAYCCYRDYPIHLSLTYSPLTNFDVFLYS